MTHPFTIDDLWSARVPSQPAISPDGSRVVFALTTFDRDTDRAVTGLWSTTADGTTRLTAGPADSAPGFLPDGSVSFLRAAHVWRIPAHGGDPVQVTPADRFPLGVLSATFSPDGTRLALVTLGAVPDPTAPLVVNTAFHKADGVGRFGDLVLDLSVLDVGSGEVTVVVGGLPALDGVAWSPDGARIAYTTWHDDRWDTDFTGAVEVVDVAAPHTRTRVHTGFFGLGSALLFTPDGAKLVVTGRPDVAIGHTTLWLVDLDGGPARRLAPELDRNVLVGSGGAYPGALPRLAPDGRTLYFAIRDRGMSHLYSVDWATPGAPARHRYGTPTESVDGLAVSVHSGHLVVVRAAVDAFAEVLVLDPTGTEAHRTALATGPAPTGWEPRAFEISDGATVHGWLLRPCGTTGRTPLLLDIHGGPHNAWAPLADANFFYHHDLAARGWSVLLLDPRGSDGYGEEFYTGLVGGWGSADARDFLEPVAALVDEGLVDRAAVAVTGYSYGGYATCHLTSRHPGVFAAAVAGGVVTDLAGVSGSSDLAHYFSALEMGQGAATDLAALHAASPIARVHDVTAPTLVLHGLDDQRCPVNQAEQWFTGLREAQVITRLVLYPGASHLFVLTGPPSQRLDYRRRLLDWLKEHVR
ncbi:S9 family peptidase [Actinosynnema sp. NPDC020468]|uniref:S9 family peptidase n=1 Tax=Actinosynnema sp. NPDC020468 TaxID=3154488 RepID=UPI0033D3F0C1